MTLTDILTAHQRVRHPHAAKDYAIQCYCGWETPLTLDEAECLDLADWQRGIAPILAVQRHTARKVGWDQKGAAILRILDGKGEPTP